MSKQPTYSVMPETTTELMAEMTRPDSPTAKNQKYRLVDFGKSTGRGDQR